MVDWGFTRRFDNRSRLLSIYDKALRSRPCEPFSKTLWDTIILTAQGNNLNMSRLENLQIHY
jgi:hypothetical protein